MFRVETTSALSPISSEPNGRSLLISGHKVEVVLPVAPDLWSTASLVHNDFKLKALREAEESQAKVDFNELELFLSFVDHTLPYLPMQCENFPIRLFVKQLFLVLHTKYFGGNDPHSCLKKLGVLPSAEALRIYYDTYVKLVQCNGIEPEEVSKPNIALFQEVKLGKAKLLAVFGGQGLTEALLEELVELDHVYFSFTRPFLKSVAPSILRAADTPEAREYMSKGFDVVQWIDKPETRPPKEYLFDAAVSLPLVGLVQLLNYYVTFKVLRITPAELRSLFVGACGHSQGIVAAVVISKSRTEQEFVENTVNALQTLFWIGLRSQQVYPETTLSPKILSDSLAHGEGIPTPMLAVANMPLTELQAQVDISNKFLGDGHKIVVSLLNGPRAIVCSGPPKSLYGLNLLLRKLKAPSSLDQTKIPFSERKLRFSTKFLPISSPFHCSYLESAVELILEDVEKNKIGFLKELDLGIPVIRTDTGKLLNNFNMVASARRL